MKLSTFLIAIFWIIVISKSARFAADSASEASLPVQIDVAVLSFNCPKFTGHLKYTLRSDATTTDYHVMTSKITADDYLLTFSVQPGHYELLLDSEIPDKDDPLHHSDLCETQQWFTALPVHERHLALVLGDVMTPHSVCSIAGSLPAAGLGIDLVLPKGHMIADSVVGGHLGPSSEEVNYGAEIDGSAFYI
jgi:hypothetical protein